MPMNAHSDGVWRNWLGRRVAEVAVFAASLVLPWSNLEVERILHVSSWAPQVLAIALVYGAWFFYYPLSAALWFLLIPRCNARRLTDSAIFLVHSVAAMLLIHGGLAGVYDEILTRSPVVLCWAALMALHLFLGGSVLVKRASPGQIARL